MKAKIVLVLLFFLGTQWVCAQNITSTATEFTVKNPEITFLGAILEANSLNKDAHQLVNVPLNPVTMSFSSLSLGSREIAPSYTNMMAEIRAALKESGASKPNHSFSYTTSQVESYRELGFLFGQEINPATLFGVKTPQKLKKTLAVVNMKQVYFSVDMDIPEQLCADLSQISAYGKDDLIYVGSVQFGRRVVLMIESNFDYQEVRLAVDNLLKAETVKVDEKSKMIIANSTIRFMAIGDEKMPEMDLDNPFATLLSYMNQERTSDNFGIPISFSASYLSNHGVFANTYTTK